MHVLEAQWLGERLAAVPDAELFPVLNLGSSTEEYRTVVQPHVDRHLFAPLRARGGAVWHLDIKAAPGVDIVGDLYDPAFQRRLADLKPRSILVNNVLHHITNRREIEDILLRIVPPGGRLFVSGPYAYPRHYDPIDTMFRPTVEEIAAEFRGTEVESGAIIDSGNWMQWRTVERGGRSLPRTLVRLLLPFYRYEQWRRLAVQSPYILRHIKAFAVVLRKRGDAAR